VALVHCENCTQLIDADVLPYCDEECRQIAHRRYLGRPAQETPTTRSAPPRRRTVSIREGFAALADESLSPGESSRRNRERETDMIARLVLGPRRPDRTPRRCGRRRGLERKGRNQSVDMAARRQPVAFTE
jgi:hypothetical protein